MSEKEGQGDLAQKEDQGDLAQKEHQGDLAQKKDQGDLEQKEDQGDLVQKVHQDLVPKEHQGDLDQKEHQGDLDQKEHQGDLDQKEHQGDLDQKEHQGDLDQKEHQGDLDQKEHQGDLDQKEHQGGLDQKEHQGDLDQKEHQGDLDQKEHQADVDDLTENVEYEDDFEKDLECLIDEEEKQILGERENPEENEEDVVAQILEVAESIHENIDEMEESLDRLSEVEVNVTVIYANEKYLGSETDSESDTERESCIQVENEQELTAEEDEEIKRYILGKIEEANKELENQAPVEEGRERKLKFKDEVNPQAPPPEDADHAKGDDVGKTDLAKGDDVGKTDLAKGDDVGKTDLAKRDDVGITALAKRDDVSAEMCQLQIYDGLAQKPILVSEPSGSEEEAKDGKVLVEKDGKFELLSIRDIECQGILPPMSVSFTDTETQHTSPKSAQSSSLSAASEMKEMPTSDSEQLPDSALNSAKDVRKQKSEPASVPVKSSTYSLTPRQKELRKQIELRNEMLRREEEERKKELEEVRRQENEIVYKAWLQRKKEQIQEEKRIRRAKKMEELRFKDVNRDPEEAYRLWLKKKHQQYVKEKRLAFLKRQAEEPPCFSRTEESDRAFRNWVRRKREEKRAAELADKETARQIRLEARRTRQRRTIQYI